jgi:pyruvate-formate lyase
MPGVSSFNSNGTMKRTYWTPQTNTLTVHLGTVLMASGNGRHVSSNLGVGISPVALDPVNAW